MTPCKSESLGFNETVVPSHFGSGRGGGRGLSPFHGQFVPPDVSARNFFVVVSFPLWDACVSATRCI